MKYGIAINGKFALINEDENRIRKTITLCMPQYSAAQIKTYVISEVEQGHDGNWYEKGHAPQRPLEEIKVAKLIELGTAFEKPPKPLIVSRQPVLKSTLTRRRTGTSKGWYWFSNRKKAHCFVHTTIVFIK